MSAEVTLRQAFADYLGPKLIGLPTLGNAALPDESRQVKLIQTLENIRSRYERRWRERVLWSVLLAFGVLIVALILSNLLHNSKPLSTICFALLSAVALPLVRMLVMSCVEAYAVYERADLFLQIAPNMVSLTDLVKVAQVFYDREGKDSRRSSS